MNLSLKAFREFRLKHQLPGLLSLAVNAALSFTLIPGSAHSLYCVWVREDSFGSVNSVEGPNRKAALWSTGKVDTGHQMDSGGGEASPAILGLYLTRALSQSLTKVQKLL